MVFTILEVLAVGLVRPAVPFAGEDTLSTYRFKTETKASDAREQIDEPKFWIWPLS